MGAYNDSSTKENDVKLKYASKPCSRCRNAAARACPMCKDTGEIYTRDAKMSANKIKTWLDDYRKEAKDVKVDDVVRASRSAYWRVVSIDEYEGLVRFTLVAGIKWSAQPTRLIHVRPPAHRIESGLIPLVATLPDVELLMY